MYRIFGFIFLLCFSLRASLAFAQLREFEVSELKDPNTQVVQADRQHPQNALLLIYSSLPNLNFRSSLGGVNKQTYNSGAGRYEVLIEPLKQMLFIQSPGFMELKFATLSPMIKEVFYFKAEERKVTDLAENSGKLKIVSEPKDCDLFLNGIPVPDKTPFEGEWPVGAVKVKLKKAKFATKDTLVMVKSGETLLMNLSLSPTTLFLNIESEPSKVTLGVMPDYSFIGPGLRIDGVTDGRPASKAGFKAGDILMKIGDFDIQDIYSYMEILAKFKKGDKTSIVLKRYSESLKKEVEF